MTNPLSLVATTVAFISRGPITPHPYSPSSHSTSPYVHNGGPSLVRFRDSLKTQETTEETAHPLLDHLPDAVNVSVNVNVTEWMDKPGRIFDITQQLFSDDDSGDTASSDFWSRILPNASDDSPLIQTSNSETTGGASREDLEDYNQTAQNRDPEIRSEPKQESSNDNETGLNVLKPLQNLFSDKTNNAGENRLMETATRWMGYVSPATDNGEMKLSIQDLVQSAQQSFDENDVTDQKSFQEILTILRQYSGDLKGATQKHFGSMDFSQLSPTSLYYYLEHEDEVKNPSWKRRMHRFYPKAKLKQLDNLHDALVLARVSYLDSMEEVTECLGNLTEPHELIYCDLVGEPSKPAHYLAIKEHQPPNSPYLELVIGIRGTKTITDAITDLLFQDIEYRGGRAHSGILDSGRYIVEKHKSLLEHLLQTSGKQKIKLKLAGHSLGAGIAAIVALELSDTPDIDVEVVGFGTPALLSQDLCEKLQGTMTTVVADNDIVPRLSAATVINALADVMEFDYSEYARRDIEHTAYELQRLHPGLIDEDRVQAFLDQIVDPLLSENNADAKASPQERVDPVLYPPGEIIHFYRDGVGISESIVPCTFFGSIDLKRRMIDDHLFHTGYEHILLGLVRERNSDHNFQFENPVPY